MKKFLPIFLLLALGGVFLGQLLSPPTPPQFVVRPLPADILPDSLKGKKVLISFFASWCAPCQIEHPQLLELQKQGVVIYGIAYKDKLENVSEFLAKEGNPYTQLAYDTDGTTAIKIGAIGVPETFMVNAEGQIIYHQQGPILPEALELYQGLWQQ